MHGGTSLFAAMLVANVACGGGSGATDASPADATPADATPSVPDAGPDTAFISQLAHPLAVAVDGTHVYWLASGGTDLFGNPASGNISRAPLAGGAPELVIDVEPDTDTLVGLEGGHVYWLTKTPTPGLVRAPFVGAVAAEPIVADKSHHQFDDGRLYYIEMPDAYHELASTALDGSDATTIFRHYRWLDPIDIHDGVAYAASRIGTPDNVMRGIFRIATVVGERWAVLETVSLNADYTVAVAADDDNVFWADPVEGEVWVRRVTLATGDEKIIAKEPGTLVSDLLLDGNVVHFVVRDDIGDRIVTSSVTPAPPIRNAYIGRDTRGMTHDAGYFYWVEPGDAEEATGSVHRLAK